MKANHNTIEQDNGLIAVVVNISNSKNESKSQPKLACCIVVLSCGKYQ